MLMSEEILSQENVFLGALDNLSIFNVLFFLTFVFSLLILCYVLSPFGFILFHQILMLHNLVFFFFHYQRDKVWTRTNKYD